MQQKTPLVFSLAWGCNVLLYGSNAVGLLFFYQSLTSMYSPHGVPPPWMLASPLAQPAVRFAAQSFACLCLAPCLISFQRLFGFRLAPIAVGMSLVALALLWLESSLRQPLSFFPSSLSLVGAVACLVVAGINFSRSAAAGVVNTLFFLVLAVAPLVYVVFTPSPALPAHAAKLHLFQWEYFAGAALAIAAIFSLQRSFLPSTLAFLAFLFTGSRILLFILHDTAQYPHMHASAQIQALVGFLVAALLNGYCFLQYLATKPKKS